jgi:formylglycine-generating enzyme required for sulfatase activity
MKIQTLLLTATLLLMPQIAPAGEAAKKAKDAPAAKPPTAKEVAAVKKLEAKNWTVPEIDLKMNRIPKGTFVMGSPADEKNRRKDEVEHEVTITKPFYMGIYEVTQRQFYKLMMPKDYDYEGWQYKRGPLHDGAAYHFRKRPHGIIFNENATGGPLIDLNPMECLTWNRAREFGRKITETERKAGRLPKGYVYRLPTEAEWEYACRAGQKGPFNVDIDHSDARNIRKFAFYSGKNWWNTSTSKCGDHRLPNAWGLYDMHGNVYEWCLDGYAPYAKGKATDPVATKGKEKVARGGCFYLEDDTAPIFMRSACRYALPPTIEFNAIVGMRLVLAPKITPAIPPVATKSKKANK